MNRLQAKMIVFATILIAVVYVVYRIMHSKSDLELGLFSGLLGILMTLMVLGISFTLRASFSSSDSDTTELLQDEHESAE